MSILPGSVSANGSLAHTRSAHKPRLEFPPSMPSPDDMDFLRVADFGLPPVASPGPVRDPVSSHNTNFGQTSSHTHEDHGASLGRGSSTQSSRTEECRGSKAPRVKRTAVRTRPQKSPTDAPSFEARPEQYKCPLCKYEQANHRVPDLKKHYNLHFREYYAKRKGDDWVCCGIPVALAADFGLMNMYRVEQVGHRMMVGGCGQTFSSKDNYRRHLEKARCLGDHEVTESTNALHFDLSNVIKLITTSLQPQCAGLLVENMTNTTTALMTSITSLPSEVVEEILVYLAERKEPLSISRLAQTCLHLRQIVYDPLDKFLWRRVFLTTFDDPRSASDQSSPEKSTFDWGQEYKSRVWTQSYVRRRINEHHEEADTSVAQRLRSKQRASPSPEETEAFKKALHTIVRVIETTAHAVNRDAEHEIPGTSLSRASLVDADDRSPTGPRAVDVDDSSKNAAWIQELISRGLPREFSPRFSAKDLDPYWSSEDDVQAVHKIVAYFGLNFEKTWADKPPKRRSSDPWSRATANRCELIPTDVYDLTPDELFARARFLARREVFDMDYLSRRRNWGPFLPYFAPKAEERIEVDEDSDSDSEDPDYIPPDAQDSEDDEDMDDDMDERPTLVVHPPRRKAPPTPENLRADWVHLAAIRVVAQASLQEHFQWADIRDTLLSLDSFRIGAWIPRSPPQLETERDWAGVEGVWRDLIYHNDRGFQKPDFDEATIVVPLTIRIVGYSPATAPGYENYPTIHIEGHMGGAGWTEGTDTRRSYGTVGIIGDGSVRWATRDIPDEEEGFKMSSVMGQPNEDEWSSEGVQIGGPGSAAGVLGLWTGAGHDNDDPLGT
ncbi:hypothetical protein EIP86_004673 [Pleurotus ostreatoroseus]|nr:hypothetical protein EIP86_004673 [Pleurotus ostreatoroseus]